MIHNSDIAFDVTEYKYDGKAQKPNVTFTVGGAVLAMNENYSVTYKNNKNVDTAYVIVKNAAVIYNGKLQNPSVVVNTSGKKLSKKKDYIIEYTNNLIAGTGYVQITGINNYEGITSTVLFVINLIPLKSFYKSENNHRLHLKIQWKSAE